MSLGKSVKYFLFQNFSENSDIYILKSSIF